MKSIKPGRGPSFLEGISLIGVALFGIFWTILTIAGGAWFMAPFGLIFTGIAVVRAIYNFKNATGKNRYSSFDITESGEEPDPLNERFGADYQAEEKRETDFENRFCPYCGAKLGTGFEFCSNCGKKLP